MLRAARIVRKCQEDESELNKEFRKARDADADEDVRDYGSCLLEAWHEENKRDYYRAKKRYYEAKLWLPQGAEERWKVIYKLRRIPPGIIHEPNWPRSAIA